MKGIIKKLKIDFGSSFCACEKDWPLYETTARSAENAQFAYVLRA